MAKYGFDLVIICSCNSVLFWAGQSSIPVLFQSSIVACNHIIKRLKVINRNDILLQLQEGLTTKQLAKGQQHKVFEDSFDAKPIYHRGFLLQKINYIHLNCVRGKWQLAEHWEDYEYIRARFYVKNNMDRVCACTL